MNKIERKKFLLPIIIFVVFCMVFFVPRYFASRMYDPMEDEFLSVLFSRDVNLRDLLIKAPDYTHPGLWYALMKYPILLMGFDNSIFIYRLIQILILFACLVFSFLYLRKKLSSRFLFAFFLLFLSNIYVVHLSIQYRMFAMLIGIAVIYSLFWFELVKNKRKLSYKMASFLAIIAILGFFTDYSMVWIIPLWPLIYLFNHKGYKDFKKILLFVSIFLMGIAWFIPVFFGNIQKSLSDNGWLFPHSAKNTTSLFLNSLGLIPVRDLNKLNFLAYPYLSLLIFMVWRIYKQKKFFHTKLIFLGVFFMFMFFLLINYFANNRLFYVRSMVSLVAVFYVLIADFFSSHSKKTIFKIIFSILILFQTSQFLIYFFQDNRAFQKYSHFNDLKHPMAYFRNFPFLDNSCLMPIPHWNYISTQYFLYQKADVITINDFSENSQNFKKNCENIYVLDQISVERYRVQNIYDSLNQAGYKPQLLESNYNQALFILEKQ